MGDYGFRISKNGVDVKTGTDVDMAITSKYHNLKGSLSGNGSVSFAASIFSETINITIAHNLGYIPIVRVSIDVAEAVGAGKYAEVPFVTGYADRWYEYICKADSTNIVISLSRQNDAGTALTVYYKYFIYIDKGKL